MLEENRAKEVQTGIAEVEESAKEGARVSTEGSDTYLGSRDRAFESPHSDQKASEIADFRGFFLFFVYCSAEFETSICILSFGVVFGRISIPEDCLCFCMVPA